MLSTIHSRGMRSGKEHVPAKKQLGQRSPTNKRLHDILHALSSITNMVSGGSNVTRLTQTMDVGEETVERSKKSSTANNACCSAHETLASVVYPTHGDGPQRRSLAAGTDSTGCSNALSKVPTLHNHQPCASLLPPEAEIL